MLTAGTASRAAIGAAIVSLTFAGAALTCASAALAGDCNTDIGALSQKRQGIMEKLNVQAKAAKGKLDPVVSCPTLRSLSAAETELLKYLTANKAWCNIPDEAVDGLKAAAAKSQGFATQACNLAVQVKKQKEQAAASAAAMSADVQKLPTGPL